MQAEEGVEQQFVTRPDGLTKSGTPLREFWGDLIKLHPHDDERDATKTIFDMDFINLEVIKSVPQYIYPSAQLNIRYSASERSGWGLMVKSLDDIGVVDLKDLVGRRIHMLAEEDHAYGNNRETGEAIAGMVWRVAEVKGGVTATSTAAPTQAEDHETLKGILNGKTATEFANLALANDAGKRQQESVMTGSFIEGLVASGAATMDEDRYVVAGL